MTLKDKKKIISEVTSAKLVPEQIILIN